MGSAGAQVDPLDLRASCRGLAAAPDLLRPIVLWGQAKESLHLGAEQHDWRFENSWPDAAERAAIKLARLTLEPSWHLPTRAWRGIPSDPGWRFS